MRNVSYRLLPLLFVLIFLPMELVSQLMFTVTSSKDDDKTYAYDDTLTEQDESVDGICRDEYGSCSLRAALHEAMLMDSSLVLSFGVSSVVLSRDLPGIEKQLIADGHNSFVLYAADHGGLAGGPDSRIENLQVVAGGVAGGDNSVISGVTVKNSRAAGIGVGKNGHISACTVEQCSIGVAMDDGSTLTETTINGGAFGVMVASDNILGPSNIIIACTQTGIYLLGVNNTIKGNRIGVDASGNADGNTTGISIYGDGNTIGGTSAADRNIISGNSVNGINITGFSATPINKVIGNYIGIDPSGTVARPNGNGIVAMGHCQIGGDLPSQRNVISGNLNGIMVTNAEGLEGAAVIKGNSVGTNPAGDAALANTGVGIIIGGKDHRVENNVISGNQLAGISLVGATGQATQNVIIAGNLIGLDASGTAAIANGSGIELLGLATDNFIGSSLSTDYGANTIANNAGAGILLDTPPESGTPIRNTFRKNSFYDNGELAVSFRNSSVQGVVPTPRLDSLIDLGSGNYKLYGGGASPMARIDVYTVAADPSDSGEGKIWLVEGDAGGDGLFEIDLPSLECGDLTAMATDQSGNSSKFSANLKRFPESGSITVSCEEPYLTTVPFTVTYTLPIDWNGLPQNGRKVTFTLNGQNEKEANLADNTATVDYDMNLAVAGTNTLAWTIESCVGTAPATGNTYDFCAIDLPSWFPSPTASCVNGKATYTRTLTFPDNAVAALTENIPSDAQVFVNGLLGLAGPPSASATFNIPGTSGPLTYSTRFQLGDQGISFSVNGLVDFQLDCNTGIQINGHVTLTANASKTFSLGYNFSQYLPTCTGALGVPIVVDICQGAHALGRIVQVGATVGGQVVVNADLSIPPLEFKNGSGTGTLSIRPFLDFFTFHANGNGSLTFAVQLPSFDVTGVQAQAEFDASESITGWSKHFGPYTYPGNQPKTSEEFFNDIFAQVAASSDKLVFTFMEDSGTVVTTAPFDATPVFASGMNGKSAVAWVARRAGSARPAGDIIVKTSDGLTWGADIALTDDIQADKSPTIALDNAGHVLVCWEHNDTADIPVGYAVYDGDYVRGFEIGYAVIDADDGSVIDRGTFGADNNRYDFKPALVKGKDGSILLVWQSTGGTTLYGKEADPVGLHGAWWNGFSWSVPEAVGTGLTGILSWEHAVHTGDTALVVMIRDTDDDFSTSGDYEPYIITRTGSTWSAPVRMSTNSSLEWGIHGTYLPDGRPALAWLKDSSVVGLIGDPLQIPQTWISDSADVGLEIMNGSLRASNDSLLLAWTQGGKILYSVAGISDLHFSERTFVNFNDDAQLSPGFHFDPTGKLRVGYLQAPFLPDSSVLSDTAEIILSPLPLSLLGSTGPILSIEESNLAFGSVPVSSSKVDSIHVTNNGTEELNIALAESNSAEFTVSPTSGSISPGGTLAFGVMFTPLSEGVKSGVITFTHNGNALTSQVSLGGTGTGVGATTVELQEKWNLISLPRMVENDSVRVLFPTALSQAFSFDLDAGYHATTRLEKGVGYWLKLDSARSVSITGYERIVDTMTVKAGWNMIGTLSDTVYLEDITQVPAENIASKFFAYTGNYTISEVLLPGRGYWVKVKEDGILILQTSAARKK